MRRTGWRLANNRGILLISSYLVLSLFLVYSSAMTMRTTSQQAVALRLREGFQATDLAQAGLEQLKEDFNVFYTSQVYQTDYAGDAVSAMQWLDDLGLMVRGGPAVAPSFNFTRNTSTALSDVTGSNTPVSEITSRNVLLPVLMGADGTGQAWISGVCVDAADEGAVVDCLPDNPLVPRLVTIEAVAEVGSVTKRIRATYEVGLGISNVFRYGYFVNNYGWLSSSNYFAVHGEVRSNGDLQISGSGVWVNGDLYASANPDVTNPVTGLPATGTIGGDPLQKANWLDYWNIKAAGTNLPVRPARRSSDPTKPAIGGTPQISPYGEGWDSDNPEQRRFSAQAIESIPYLGDLELYRTLATQHNGGTGSTLTYYDKGPDGAYGTPDDVPTTINSTYSSTEPLVLVGTLARPIVIDGPIVADGDIIIRGNVSGQGTLYAGRNVHIVGSTTYANPMQYPAIERNASTGQLRQVGITSGTASNLGKVCTNGAYVPPGGPTPGGCI